MRPDETEDVRSSEGRPLGSLCTVVAAVHIVVGACVVVTGAMRWLPFVVSWVMAGLFVTRRLFRGGHACICSLPSPHGAKSDDEPGRLPAIRAPSLALQSAVADTDETLEKMTRWVEPDVPLYAQNVLKMQAQ